MRPPPADHPLLSAPNTVLTPHVAGPTWQSWPRRFGNAYANISRVQRGERPQWVVPELAVASRFVWKMIGRNIRCRDDVAA